MRFLLAFFFMIPMLLCAQTLSGVVLDEQNSPIPFASVQVLRLQLGTIADENGLFELNTEYFNDSEVIKVSVIGYKTQEFTYRGSSEKRIVRLENESVALNTVFITNRRERMDSIVYKANAKIHQQLEKYTQCWDFEKRTLMKSNFEKIELESKTRKYLSDAEEKKLNTRLKEISKYLRERTHYYYNSLNGVYYKYLDSSKVRLKQETFALKDTMDVQKLLMKEIVSSVENFFLDDKTYKIKSGILPIASKAKITDLVKRDSISNEITRVELKKNKEDKDLSLPNDTEVEAENLMKVFDKMHLSDEKRDLKNILNPRAYKHQIDTLISLGEQMVYKIQFLPKGNSKLKGFVFVDQEDFGIHKIQFQLLPDKNYVNINLKLLLGVKYQKNVFSGVINFQKNETEYTPLSSSISNGANTYINRSISFKENGSGGLFKASKKLVFDFVVASSYRYKEEYFFKTLNTLNKEMFDCVQETKDISETEEKLETKAWE